MSLNEKKLIRTFLAFDIDEPLRAAMTDIINYLKQQKHGEKVKWVHPENLHVTLRFFGEITPEKILELQKVIATEIETINSFVLNVGRVMQFPPTSHPHTIVLSFPINQELAGLVQVIEKAVAQSGFAPENRPYLPHLTLGRLRSRQIVEIKDLTFELPEKLAIEKIILYRSDQGEKGSVYTQLSEFKLQK